MGENVWVRLNLEMLRTHWVAWTIVGLTVVINAVALWLGCSTGRCSRSLPR